MKDFLIGSRFYLKNVFVTYYFCPSPVVSQNDENLWKNLSSLRNLIVVCFSIFIVQVSELFLRKMLPTSNFLTISFQKEIIYLECVESVSQKAKFFFSLANLSLCLILFVHGY